MGSVAFFTPQKARTKGGEVFFPANWGNGLCHLPTTFVREPEKSIDYKLAGFDLCQTKKLMDLRCKLWEELGP